MQWSKYLSIGPQYAPVWVCKRTYIFVCVSNCIRVTSTRIKTVQRDISFDMVFDTGRSGSNPARSVRMQWSNTKQTGIPYAPVWIRNLLLTELVNVPMDGEPREPRKRNHPHHIISAIKIPGQMTRY